MDVLRSKKSVAAGDFYMFSLPSLFQQSLLDLAGR